MAPPPVCQALFLSFQVSLPGSPGAGMMYCRQMNFPVAASTPMMKSRTPLSPPDAPTMILSLMAIADIGFPDDLAGVLVGGDEPRRIVRDRDDEIAPQRRATIRIWRLLLLGVHAPDDASGVACAGVDLVEN